MGTWMVRVEPILRWLNIGLTYPDGAMHDAVPAIAALGVSPIVRLPDMQGWMVKRETAEISMLGNSVLTFLRCT
jgi:hypothetical protein